MGIDKGILIAVGVVLAGVVGYKVVEKRNPEAIKNAKKALAKAGKGVTDIIDSAKGSFREGYASA
ncbi:MAG: hypothetical protein HQL11_06430 [Candidatus Omnitrophica bacterium]|nr:hypothetical protein [Candidatus Omnitrophota bacterium]